MTNRRWLGLLPLLVALYLPIPAQGDALEDENIDPAVVALTHFFNSEELSELSGSSPGNTLLIHREYEKTKGFLSASQLGGDLSDETWTIPEDARQDIERRTDERPRLTRKGWPSFVHFFDLLSESAGRHYDFEQWHPHARAYVILWPTGYTPDHRLALVRFAFGPTVHGASAIYLLAMQNGRWTVLHHEVSYYA